MSGDRGELVISGGPVGLLNELGENTWSSYQTQVRLNDTKWEWEDSFVKCSNWSVTKEQGELVANSIKFELLFLLLNSVCSVEKRSPLFKESLRIRQLTK